MASMYSRVLQAGRSCLRQAIVLDNQAFTKGLSHGPKNGTSSGFCSSTGSGSRTPPLKPEAPGGPTTSEAATSSSTCGASTGGSSSSATASNSTSTSDSSSRLLRSMQAPIEAAQAEAAAAAANAKAKSGEGGQDRAAYKALSAVGNAMFFTGVAAAAFFGYYTYRYSAQELEQLVNERKQPETEFPGSSASTQVWVPVMSWYVEQRKQIEEQVKKYSDPPSEHLLPDLPPHARHVRTLVLDLDDTLVHSDWTRGRGWRTFKRPGAEDFLRQMAQYYEIVVYTDQLPTYADPILDRLDPQRYVQYRLYRDSTQYINGKHVRNLKYLNRDLDKVLLITANPDAYALQPENAVKLRPWKLEADDTALLDLLPLLEQIFRTNVADVRAVVRSFDGQDIPSAFRERMRKLAEQQQAQPRSLFGGLRR